VSTLNLKSPRKDPSFKYYWDLIIPDIKDRENLKPSHLQQLRILCDLYVEYDILKETIELTGRTYISTGRNGMQIKPVPEISLITKTIADIRNYSKSLGIVLADDKTTNQEEEDDDFK